MSEPVHIPTLYSADSEGSVLREFMDAREQNRTSQATRLSQDVPANGNATIHHEPSVQNSGNGRTQDSHHGFLSTPVPFPTPSVGPTTSESLIQESGMGAQDQRDQPGIAQNPQSTRKTVQDPGPSDRSSRESHRYKSHHELETGPPATDAQKPDRSLHFGVSEDQIPQDSVNDQPPPESPFYNPYESRTSMSIQGDTHPRSSRTFQKSRAVDETVKDAGPSKRRSHRRSRSHKETMISGTTTTEEAIRQLIEQKKETNTLRRALRRMVERVDAENQRVLALERDSHQVMEKFSMLNASRLAAQKEALNAGSELRTYQFQLANAHKDIERAQEMLSTLEKQRDEAEEAASRARARVRQCAQEQMIAAAQSEGRRLGFEAGLKRAQEEAALMRMGSGRVYSSWAPRESDSQVNSPPANFDFDYLEHVISSPVRQHTLRAHRQSIPGEPSPPPEFRVQSPTSPGSGASVREELLPPHPSENAPEVDRPASPGSSVLRYAVSIPPASEIEQQTSPTQFLDHSAQPWVTAREYHQMTGTQPSPQHVIGVNIPGGSGNVVTFAPNPLQGNPDKKKRSWFRRTLARPWRKASRVVPEASSSWYQPMSSANPPPIVRTRDFGAGAPETSADRASVSTSLSQFEIVSPPPGAPSPPYRDPHESVESFAGKGMKGRRTFMERTHLHSINEIPSDLNETLPNLRRDITSISPSMGQIREMFGDTTSNYSDPKAVEDWRRSSASVSVATEMNPSRPAKPSNAVSGQNGPPRRRPVHLTVPAPLAPQHANSPSSLGIPNGSQNLAFLGAGDVRPSIQRNPTSGTVYGITVEPPSCSPTEVPNSGRPLQENLLSPSLGYPSSFRSNAPSLQNNGPSSIRDPTSNPARPLSAASDPQAPPILPKNPSNLASSLSLAQADQPPLSQHQRPVDHPHRSSVASRATTYAPRPITDNASIRSGPRSVNAGHNTARQSHSHPAPVNPNPASHPRTVSDSTYLQTNASLQPVENRNANGVHNLHRISSNQSMSSIRSANSRYSRFDPNTYVEPTELYRPVSVGPSGQERRRTMSNATGTTLSYVSRP